MRKAGPEGFYDRQWDVCGDGEIGIVLFIKVFRHADFMHSECILT